jgi:DNA-binding beta-propeller fold protein YncE
MASDAQYERECYVSAHMGLRPGTHPFGKAEGRTSWRKVVALVVALLVLALALYSIYYYTASRRLAVPSATARAVSPPEYVFSITGPEGRDALDEPLGVDVSADDLVYVTDTSAGAVRVYTVDGEYRFSFSRIADGKKKKLATPVYVEVNSRGEVFVSDRRRRAVYVFSSDGEYLRKVTPADDKEARGWGPLAMAFDENDTLWVSDVGRNDRHQIVAFDRWGEELTRFGRSAQAEQITDVPGLFYFPNGLAVRDDRVYVADSNNQRIQVFDTAGGFVQIIQTSGIPRGLDVDDHGHLYVADALAHQGDVYMTSGERIASFGGQGVGPGEFRFTNDLALDRRGYIYLTDRVNHRVQVWRWPEPLPLIGQVSSRPMLWPLLLPLLLLPLLLLRPRRFVVTEGFLQEMAAAGRMGDMEAQRRWKWIVPAEDFAGYEGRELGGVPLDRLLTPEEHSESDAKDLVNRLGVQRPTAVLLVVAKRARTLCTQAPSLALVGRDIGVDAYDARMFTERFLDKGKEDADKEKA